MLQSVNDGAKADPWYTVVYFQAWSANLICVLLCFDDEVRFDRDQKFIEAGIRHSYSPTDTPWRSSGRYEGSIPFRDIFIDVQPRIDTRPFEHVPC